MSKVILKISYNCDNDCIFCHAHNNKKITNFDPKIILNKILHIKKEIKEIDTILFSGGEPTINKNIISYLDFAHSLGFKTGFITNGSQLLRGDIFKYIQSGNTNFIYLSLHGNNSLLHSNITSNKKSFDNVVNFLDNIKNQDNLTIIVNCVVNSFNIHNLQEIVDLVKNYNVNILKFSLLELKGLGKENINDLYVPIEIASNNIKQIIENNKDINIRWDGFSICLLKDYENKISNLQSEGINFMSELRENFIYKTNYSDREYSLKCENCKKKNICPGIYSGYIKNFGDYYIEPYLC